MASARSTRIQASRDECGLSSIYLFKLISFREPNPAGGCVPTEERVEMLLLLYFIFYLECYIYDELGLELSGVDMQWRQTEAYQQETRLLFAPYNIKRKRKGMIIFLNYCSKF